jgi:hypothetical protein
MGFTIAATPPHNLVGGMKNSRVLTRSARRTAEALQAGSRPWLAA